MPIYEFKCPECGEEYEVMQRHDTPNPHCIRCDSITERLVSRPGKAIFKGTGFYETDYKDKK